MITKETPTRIRLNFGSSEIERIKLLLTYKDKGAEYQYRRARKNTRLLSRMGVEAFQEHLEELKSQITKCILFEDDKGYWTYSGMEQQIRKLYPDSLYKNEVSYPEAKLIPWSHVPEYKPRYYQEEMKENLLNIKHGSVSVATGLGKSYVILLLAKELGLKTVVMTPSINIAKQIHKDFVYHLGNKYVGQFFEGKKESKKLITIAVDDSLANVAPGSDHWKELSQAEVFIADESHLCPAKTLAKVCLELLADVPYRFFFSGTQIRTDGLDLVLEGIIGPIVYNMSVKQGVEEEFLAKPRFRIIPCLSETDMSGKDPLDITRVNFYQNDFVCRKAAGIANLMASAMNRQVLVLIKEVEQFGKLLPYFNLPVKFAHGPLTGPTYYKNGKVKTPGNKASVPKEYWDSDPDVLVKEFNEGKIQILVGTSCISTGTDLRPVGTIVFLRGLKSEIDLRQSVGRGTRKPTGKEDCYFIDFDVEDDELLHSHALQRKAVYEDIYPDVEVLRL